MSRLAADSGLASATAFGRYRHRTDYALHLACSSFVPSSDLIRLSFCQADVIGRDGLKKRPTVLVTLLSLGGSVQGERVCVCVRVGRVLYVNLLPFLCCRFDTQDQCDTLMMNLPKEMLLATPLTMLLSLDHVLVQGSKTTHQPSIFSQSGTTTNLPLTLPMLIASPASSGTTLSTGETAWILTTSCRNDALFPGVSS